MNAKADAQAALLNSGYLEIYDGTQPATADTAITTQVNLATLTFAATAFGASVAGVATANAIGQDASANATGTASWFRCFKTTHVAGSGDEAALRVIDGSVGAATSNLILNTVSIVINAAVSCSSFTLTEQKG